MTTSTAVSVCSTAVLVLGAVACAPARDRAADEAAPAVVHLIEGAIMGTTYTIRVVSESTSDVRLASLRREIEATLAGVDEKMSTYRPDSEISQFNAARTTDPFAVSRDTLAVIEEARAVSDATGGAFDVTVGPLVDAWGFGPPGEPAAFPTDAEIEQLLRRVGYQRMEIDSHASTIRKTDPAIAIDLSALAKGYAVDRVAERLGANGIESFLVEIGGEIRTAGQSERGDAWRVGIERPEPGSPTVHRLIPLRGQALATSGDYRNYYEIGGQRLSHTIDPRTGRPVRHGLASASVVASRCIRADAIATALEVLGPDEGFTLAVEQGWAALLIGRGEGGALYERETPAFAALQ